MTDWLLIVASPPHRSHLLSPTRHTLVGTLYYGNNQGQFIKRELYHGATTSGGQLSGLRPIEGLPVEGMRQVPQHNFCSIVHDSTLVLLLLLSFIHTHSLIQSRSQYEWHGPSIMSCGHLTYSVNHFVVLMQSIIWYLLVYTGNIHNLDPLLVQEPTVLETRD